MKRGIVGDGSSISILEEFGLLKTRFLIGMLKNYTMASIDPLRLGDLAPPPQLTLEAARRYDAYDKARAAEQQAPPYYLAAPDMPSQPPPTQVVDRQQFLAQQQDELRQQQEQERRQREAIQAEIDRRMAPAQPFLRDVNRWNAIGQQAIAQEPINRGRRAEAQYAAQTPDYTPETGSMGNFGFSDIPRNIAGTLGAAIEPLGNIGQKAIQQTVPGQVAGAIGKVLPGQVGDAYNAALNMGEQSAGFIAADVLTGGALTPIFGAQATAQSAAIGQDYNSGKIDGRMALIQLAQTLPQAIPFLMHGAGKLADFARTPEGQRIIAKLPSERGGGTFGEKPPSEPPAGAGDAAGVQEVVGPFHATPRGHGLSFVTNESGAKLNVYPIPEAEAQALVDALRLGKDVKIEGATWRPLAGDALPGQASLDDGMRSLAGAGEAAGLPAAADNLPPPPESIQAGLLTEQGDVISLTKKPAASAYELNPLQRHYPEQQLAPEAKNLDIPVIGEAPTPRLQPALGLLDEHGNIIDPLDPQAALIRQAFGGEIPTLPPDITPALVRENLQTWNQYAGQLADSQRALSEAVARRKALDTLYQSPEQRAIRTAQRAASKQGLTGDTSSAIPKEVMDEARNAVNEARRASDAAKEAMKTAHIRVGDEDIARRLAGVGVDERVIRDVQVQFEISQVQQRGEADFLTMPGWRKRLEQVYNRFGGNLSGPVGASANRAINLSAGLNVWVNDFGESYLAPMQRLLDRHAENLRFVGDARYSGLADTHRLWYVFTHPEDFRGITPEMHRLLNQAEQEGKAFYQGVRQFDPLNTAKPVNGRYLPQMWEDGIDHVERFGHARGKAFITKERAWKDWREALLSDKWPKELADMTPGQALEYAHRAAAQQMSDFYMRRDILKTFGSRTQQAGMLPFESPMYKGWYAKPEIVSQVDAFFQPAGDLIRPAAHVLQPIKNIRYGIDFAIWGYNVLHTLAGGNVQIAAGLMERALHGTGLRTIGEFADEGLMIQHGLAARGLESPFHKGGATPLSWIPALRGIDSKMTKGLDWLQHTQYSNIMGPIRHLVAQGNVALERTTGELTASKLARAMDNANAITGTSRGAQRGGRAYTESVLLGSARITRSQFAMLGQLVKIGTPESIATLASYGVTIGAVGMTIDRLFGDGRGYEFSPFSLKDGKLEYNSEWANVHIKGRSYNLIPQASLARAIAKSMAAASQMDAKTFSTAWAQYGYTRTTPGLQGGISATTGAGFAEGKPFSPFGGLGIKDRLLAMAPVPVAGTSQLDSSQRGIRPGIESTLGLSSHSDVPSKTQAAKAAKQPVLEKLRDYIAVPNEEFKNRAKDLSAAFSGMDMGKYGSLKDFKAAYKKDWAPVIAKEKGVSLHTAEDMADAEVDRNPVIKKLNNDVTAWQDDYWRNHRDLAQQAWDQKLPDAPRAAIRSALGIK